MPERPPVIPRVEVLGDREYRLLEAYTYQWLHEGYLYRITVPEGFVCDGNSVPWFARPWIPGDWSLGVAAVVVHDWLYAHKGVPPLGSVQIWYNGNWVDALRYNGKVTPIQRRDADRLFARMMREWGVPKWRRRMAYRGVRAAFWHNWDERGRKEEL
jgi:hypothetical protein